VGPHTDLNTIPKQFAKLDHWVSNVSALFTGYTAADPERRNEILMAILDRSRHHALHATGR